MKIDSYALIRIACVFEAQTSDSIHNVHYTKQI